MAQKPHYTDGEKVLCFHGPLLYEAKCLKSQMKDKTIKYLIHYSGWNKNWDEWVPECRVLKYNEENLAMQSQLEKTHNIPKSKKSKSSKSSSKKASEKEKDKAKEKTKPKEKAKEKGKEVAEEKKKAPVVHEKPVKQPKGIKREPTTPPAESLSKPPEPKRAKQAVERQFEEEPKPPVEIKFAFPEFLKDKLLDDMDLITHQKKVLRLPARVTVNHVIADYVKAKVALKSLTARNEVTIVRMANRLRDCFNVLLGKRLLHKFERPQYAEILAENNDRQMSEIYGAIHLLRMFTPLGLISSILAERGRDVSVLVSHIEDFIAHMGSNPNFFSLDDYVVASPEYQRRALV